MSEETKKILKLIYHLTSEVRRNTHEGAVICPKILNLIHTSTLRDIRKEFPDFNSK